MFNKTEFPAFAIFMMFLFLWFYQTAYAETMALNLPSPDGCFAVGTRTSVLRDARRKRDLLVTFWYPAERGSSAVAPYMDSRTASALAKEWDLQPGFEDRVHAHAMRDAAIAHSAPFPIVLLEHGSSVVPAIYTVLAEGLASSGYVVVATNHPPDSLIAVFPDGHELKFTEYWPADADRRTQGIAIGKFAEEVLAADVHFVLNELQEMNMHDHFWHHHLDLSKVGIVGHSMGGTTAAVAMQKESRIVAGVNLDGSTYPGMNGDERPIPLHKPFLFLATEEHATGESRAREYVGGESNTYYVVVQGADHMSFSDGDLISARFSRDSKPDEKGFEEAQLRIELTRSMVEEFLGKYLKGASAPHLDVSLQLEKR